MLKKYLSEAFDFNDEVLDDDDMSQSFNTNIIKSMTYYDRFIKGKQRLLLLVLEYALKCVIPQSTCTSVEPKTTNPKDAWAVLSILRIDSFLLANSHQFDEVNFSAYFIKNKYFLETFSRPDAPAAIKRLVDCINHGAENAGLDVNESSAYLSKDKGIIIFQIVTRLQKFRILTFTGDVDYSLTLTKQSLAAEKLIPYMWDWLLTKNCGTSLLTYRQHGFSLLTDKNNYPILATVITSANLYRDLPKLFYKQSIISGNWTAKLPTTNSRVLMRKDSIDGYIQAGLFYPWPIKDVYKDKPFICYSRDTLQQYHYDNQRTINEYSPTLGVFVYQLSPKGKEIFNAMKQAFSDVKSISKNKIESFFENYDNGNGNI